MAKKIINTSGTRKTSVARVTLKEGTGLVRINGNAIETHTPEMARMKIIEPLLILEDLASKVDIQVNVFGGGINSLLIEEDELDEAYSSNPFGASFGGGLNAKLGNFNFGLDYGLKSSEMFGNTSVLALNIGF